MRTQLPRTHLESWDFSNKQQFIQIPLTLFYWHCPEVWLWVGRRRWIVADKFVWAWVGISDVPPVHAAAVRAGREFETTILRCCVIEREPKADQFHGIRVKECCVLVRAYCRQQILTVSIYRCKWQFNNFYSYTFTAYTRVFVDVHALYNGWHFQAQFLAHFFDFVVKGEFLESWVQPVQSVANLFKVQKCIKFDERAQRARARKFWRSQAQNNVHIALFLKRASLYLRQNSLFLYIFPHIFQLYFKNERKY